MDLHSQFRKNCRTSWDVPCDLKGVRCDTSSALASEQRDMRRNTWLIPHPREAQGARRLLPHVALHRNTHAVLMRM